jgi:predicted MFS family arabinose efflux permease
MGVIGLAIGGGATLSTEIAGLVADRFHTDAAFGALAAVGVVVLLLLWWWMPETRDSKQSRKGELAVGPKSHSVL